MNPPYANLHYLVVRERPFRWSVLIVPGGDEPPEALERHVATFWRRSTAQHIADHLHLAYHAGLVTPGRNG